MPKGLQNKGIIRRNKILHAAVSLFLENGYEKTTTASIAKAAGVAPSSFFAAFESKEALLLTLTKLMFDSQFASAEQMTKGVEDPVLMYAVETAIQMYITECSEPLREIYVMAYSLPSTSEYIYSTTANRLARVFGLYLPEAKPKDFYEMDIASSGVMRAFMAKKCDVYFTMERKLRRFLQCGLAIYAVPEEKQRQVVETVLHMDLQSIAEKILSGIVAQVEAGLESAEAQI